MFDRERLVWILDVLLSRGLIHEGQKKDVLNRGDDQARHIMLDKRAELRRLLGPPPPRCPHPAAAAHAGARRAG